MQDSSATTAYSAKAETPRWWLTGAPSQTSRRAPDSSEPATLARKPGSHNAGRPPAQGRQWPQLGMNTITT